LASFPIFIIPEVLLTPLIEKEIILLTLFSTDGDNIFLSLLLIDYFISLFLNNIKIGSLDTNKLLLILSKF
jgi:hypothetical protein